jgi:hypothetical protein
MQSWGGGATGTAAATPTPQHRNTAAVCNTHHTFPSSRLPPPAENGKQRKTATFFLEKITGVLF